MRAGTSPPTHLRTDIENHRHTFLDHPLTALVTQGAPQFVHNHLNGMESTACANPAGEGKVLKTTDERTPLAYTVGCGEGTVVFVNCVAYPGSEVIRPVYEQVICDCRRRIAEQEPGQILCGEDVQRLPSGGRHPAPLRDPCGQV